MQSWKQSGLAIYTILTGIVSIVALAVVLVKDPGQVAFYLFLQSIIIISMLLSTVCYLALSLKSKDQIQRERDDLGKRLGDVNHAITRLHEVPHRCRDILVSLSSEKPEVLGADFFQLQSNALVDVFKDLTGKQCALCIKTLSNDNANVLTLCRDSTSHSKRSANNVERNVAANTAFNSIMIHGDQFYASNNLKALGASYRNDTPKWNDLYNSTIVVPIRCAQSPEQQVVHGFLCVDSSESDVFDIDAHPYLLGIAADSLFLPLDTYRRRLNAVSGTIEAKTAGPGSRKH